MSPACQVSFYVLADAASSAGHLACRLCSMAWEGGHRVTVLTGDAAESQALDELMWDHPPQRFLPHEVADGGSAAPVVIVSDPDKLPADRSAVINLAAVPVPEPTRFQRLLEIVPADPRYREASREKYRRYRDLGLKPETHEMQSS